MLKDKIKNYREENNLTQKKLAEILGVSRTTIAEIEGGRIKGTVKFLTKLAGISNKPISYWADDDIEKNYKTYEALDILLDAMIDSGMIGSDGKLNESAQKLVISVLEKEIVIKLKNREE